MADDGKRTHESVWQREVTPIPLSPRAAVVLAVLVLAALVVVLWAAPSALYIALGGGTLALILSFPVRLLSRVTRRGLAVLLTVLVLLGLIALALGLLVPLLVDQLGALIFALPGIATSTVDLLEGALEALEEQEVCR